MEALQFFDQEEERERRELEAAIAEVAVSDSRFQPWWQIYRNHHKGPVILLPHRKAGEGSYLWHFHITRRLNEQEKRELLTTMRSVVHKALDTCGVAIIDELDPADELDLSIAAIIFSVPVRQEEQQRRIESRRVRSEEIKRWYRQHQ